MFLFLFINKTKSYKGKFNMNHFEKERNGNEQLKHGGDLDSATWRRVQHMNMSAPREMKRFQLLTLIRLFEQAAKD